MSTPSSTKAPTVSHVGSDGALVELLYDPVKRSTALAHLTASGEAIITANVTLSSGESLVPYSPTNNLITGGCILLPSQIGDLTETATLVRTIKTFLRHYVSLSPLFAEIAPYYVLLSWVYDAFGELPYLRFRGDYGTGKTRALMTIGSLCYKPFFASGASTVSPIFHILDGFRGTLVLDEADLRFSDATADLTKILNNGNSDGLPVLRTMTNRHRELNPKAFRVYGPKIIAMRESFADAALESRFLTEETVIRPLTDVPLHLPARFHDEARDLRNQLLAWRFAHRHLVSVDLTRAVQGIEPRFNQTALALLSLIDDPAVRALIGEALAAEQGRQWAARAASLEGQLVAAVLTAFDQDPPQDVTVGGITACFNQRGEGGAALSQKAVGNLLRQRLRLSPVRRHGVYVLTQDELPRLQALAVRFGVAS